MNPCGTCNACCTVFPIAELGKPSRSPCRHLKDGGHGVGCLIYAARPAPCRSYRCGWLAEGWDLDLRPDLCGVLLTHSPSKAGATLTAIELRPGIIRGAWDLWVEKARSEPIAIYFVAEAPVLLGRDAKTYPIDNL